VPAIKTSDDFRLLAAARADEAQALLGASLFSGAFYLAGYAVEFGLKAILTRDLTPYGMPDKRGVSDAWIHDLQTLAKDAGVADVIAADPNVGPSWLAAKGWTEASRYRVVTQQEAEDLVFAVTDPTSGVLPWLTQYW
jgi:hypothetical protein